VSDLVGRTLEGYRIEAELGRGGQAVVYRATQLSLQRQVALKVVTAGLGLDPGFMERFRREGVSAAQLDHPHVVPVYEAGESDGIAFIAMKLIDGPTLDALVRAEGLLPPRRALALLGQAAEALDYAAARGLVHRDVKPANILIGPGDHAYLSDFGLTKALESTTALTRSGTWMGTLEYIAPEQIRGEQVTPAADRYALGVIAYELLTGRSPFPREDRAAVMYAHLHDVPAPPSEVRPELGPAVDAVMERALAKDPAERPATAVQLVDELRRAVESVAARGGTPAAETTPPAPPTVSGEAPSVTSAPPQKRRPSRRVLVLGGGGAVAAIGVAVGLVVGLSGGDGGPTSLRTVTIQPTTESTSSPTTPADESFPTLEEAALVGRAPESIRPSCERTSETARATGSAVSIRCVLRGQFVYYEEFPTLTATRDYYESIVAARGLTRDQGPCPGRRLGEASYSQGGPGLGRVACYPLEDSPTVIWTNEPLRVVSTMVGIGKTPKQLLALWKDAGPYR
jgi:serine/threonine protein kinase